MPKHDRWFPAVRKRSPPESAVVCSTISTLCIHRCFHPVIRIADLWGSPRFPHENKADGVGFFPHERLSPLPVFKPERPLPRLPTRTPRKTGLKGSSTFRFRGKAAIGPPPPNRDTPRPTEQHRERSHDKQPTRRALLGKP